jgi:hypothetical protein
MRLRVVLLWVSLAIGLLPTRASAGIIFTLGNNPQPGEENVLLNDGSTGTTVFGTTNQSLIPVEFDSTQLLTEPVAGQARIEATDGTSQVGLTNVTISVPNGSYGDLIFNPDLFGTVGVAGGTLHVSVLDNLGNIATFDYTLGSGSNFLTITTVAGERIVSTGLSYSLGDGFTDLRQIRISDAQAVPEPAAVTLLGTGLGMIGFRRYRRSVRSNRIPL